MGMDGLGTTIFGAGAGAPSVTITPPYIIIGSDTYGPGNALVAIPPTSGSWTALGSPTLTGGGTVPLLLSMPSSGGSDSQGVILQSLPSAPWTVTAQISAIIPTTGVSAARWGIMLRNSGSAAMTDLVAAVASTSSVPQIMSLKWSALNTFSTYYVGSGNATGPFTLPLQNLFLKIVDDATNRLLYFSADGVNYQLVFSVGDTDFITPNQAGVCLDTLTSPITKITILSFNIQSGVH